jgi:hypothetical protein
MYVTSHTLQINVHVLHSVMKYDYWNSMNDKMYFTDHTPLL